MWSPGGYQSPLMGALVLSIIFRIDLARQALNQGHIVALEQDLAQLLPCLLVVRLRDLPHFDRIVNLFSMSALSGP